LSVIDSEEGVTDRKEVPPILPPPQSSISEQMHDNIAKVQSGVRFTATGYGVDASRVKCLEPSPRDFYSVRAVSSGLILAVTLPRSRKINREKVLASLGLFVEEDSHTANAGEELAAGVFEHAAVS
jgi:hypothetical protein